MSDDEDLEVSADILRNKGVPVTLALVDTVLPALPPGQSVEALQRAGVELPPVSWRKVIDDAGEVVTEERHLRFTINNLADLEVEFQSLGLWQNAAQFRTLDCARRTFAVVWGGDKRQWGEAMLEQHLGSYGAAIGAAWAMANGVDPQQAAEILKVARAAVAGDQRLTETELLKKMASIISRMPSGSVLGSAPTT